MDDLWPTAKQHLDEGNFTSLQNDLGGPEAFDRQIVEWYGNGRFDGEDEILAEALTCACMLGRMTTAAFLIDEGVDPYAGMKTWLAGPHYAVSSGHLDTVKMLIEKGVPLEIKNLHGGTMLGQGFWSVVNEYKPSHRAIIEALIEAGAVVEPGTLEWWREQSVPDASTKAYIEDLLVRHDEFYRRVSEAENHIAEAEAQGQKRALADALKRLGDIARRPAFLRSAANTAYSRAAELYHEIGAPLEEAWVKRHIGINLEYDGRLEDAEKFYDEALDLYRKHAVEDTLDYANTVRYPAVIKARLGKLDEAKSLWDEAGKRYSDVGIIEGVIECNARMAEIAIANGDLDAARQSLERALSASANTQDPETLSLIESIKAKLEDAEDLGNGRSKE